MGIWRVTKPISSILRRSQQSHSFSSSGLQSRLENVGFIGLGNMGAHMATNLIKSGFKVSVHDINAAAVKPFLDKGVPVMETPTKIAEASDVVITMLPSSTHVTDVYRGPNGLLQIGSSLRPWLFIDSSTIDPLTSRKLSESVSGCSLKEKLDGQENPVMLDAPVSGGILAAEAGTLTCIVSCLFLNFRIALFSALLLVILESTAVDRGVWVKGGMILQFIPMKAGGAEEAYLAAEPLFRAMGRTSIYCGGAGNGLVAKICNNLVLATSMIGVSEALSVGQSLGISASTLTRILNCSTGRCWSSDTYNPVPGVMKGVPSSRDYQGGCSSKILAKDLNLATLLAEEAVIKHPITELANEIFHELCKEGHEAKDFSCIFRYYYGGRDEFPQS